MNDYNKIGWVNGSEPALCAENLNHMDDGIKAATDEITTVQANVEKIQKDIASKVDTTAVIKRFDKLLSDPNNIPTAMAVINFLNGYYYSFDQTYSSDEVDELCNELNKKINDLREIVEAGGLSGDVTLPSAEEALF